MSENERKRPAMGEWCMVVNEADKKRKDLPEKGNSYHRVSWGHRYIGWNPEPVKAMYIGWRMKREGVYWEQGWHHDGDSDWERCFKIEKSVEVWLFVPNARSKPFAVFPQDVTICNDESKPTP
jgi:hypothetical protein